MIPERIEVDGATVTFAWEDGETATFDAATLRGACECAVCREPAGRRATAAVLAGDEPITISDARLVGGYAISFTFGPDRHATGIYPFERLRALASASDTSS